MPGAIAIIVVLLLAPVLICLSMAAVAAVLGQLLWKDGEERFPDSELIDVNV